MKLAPTSQETEDQAALAFAMAGDTARAESLAQDLGRRFPLDTQMQSLWLPAIRAQLALDKKNPASALNVLQAASPIELGALTNQRRGDDGISGGLKRQRIRDTLGDEPIVLPIRMGQERV